MNLGVRGDGWHEERRIDLRHEESDGDAALVLLAQDVPHVVRQERRDLRYHLAHAKQEQELEVCKRIGGAAGYKILRYKV